MFAAWLGGTLMLRHMLSQERFSRHLNSVDARVKTAAMWAVEGGQLESLNVLADAGADLSVSDAVGAWPCIRLFCFIF
eukprot:m.719723 g.719723  ORF g.719723 m.719723 type:complete len:78 (-) comp58813_c0_seq31:205-438(-)